MHRKALILLCLLLLALPLAAQTDTIRIDWPPPVYVVAGPISVAGAVNPPDLLNYFLEVSAIDPAAPDADPVWIPASLPRNTPVQGGVIAAWDTTRTPDGLYRLRLHVRLRSGESLFYVVEPLRVDNRAPADVVAQPPLATATQPALIPLPTVAPPAATEEPTAEPTIIARPNPVNRLPLPVGGHVITFSEDTVEAMRSAEMTWMKWQVPFIVGDDSLLDVARDRINHAHANGFNVLLSIKGDKNELENLWGEYFPLYADFVGRVAALGPDAIQVWNEQNLDREWPTGRIDPASYADLLRQAYTAIKAADPQVQVITGAPAPTGAEGAFGPDRVWNDDRYYQGMASAGVADFADCIGVHYNEGIIAPQQQGGDPREPDYPTRYLPLMLQRAAFPFRDSDIPLCFSELGYLSPEGYGPLPQGFAWATNTSVEEQAAWLRDAITIAANFDQKEVALLIVWNVDFDVYTEDDPQGGYAIIRPDGTCPACETIASLATP